MASIRSIFEYINGKCYNGLYAAAQEYFDGNWQSMELYSRRVPSIDKAELIDADIQRVYVTDRPGDRIAFDVGLELEIAVSAADRHNDSEDTCYQWLRISCEGNLACGLDDWSITGIIIHERQAKNAIVNALLARGITVQSIPRSFEHRKYESPFGISAPYDFNFYIEDAPERLWYFEVVDTPGGIPTGMGRTFIKTSRIFLLDAWQPDFLKGQKNSFMLLRHQVFRAYYFYYPSLIFPSFQHFPHPFLFYYTYAKKSAKGQTFSTG